MAYLKEIKEEIRQITSLRDLTQVYGEIASTRMRKIRGFVLRNREFLANITSIFRDTLKAYAQQQTTPGKVTFLAHNGKTVATLISANTGFFGEVVKETFKKFINDVRREDLEVTIIGKI